ncbi:MAG: TatD family hydrolase [Gemmatimonadaceae bacterium]|nr:TatD family hydrolase [Gemmatimonadaceae bacterium]
MARFIDSHVHLSDPAFDSDRAEVIARARATGAQALVCIGESLAAAARAELIAQTHPGFVYFTAGVHPHDAAGFDPISDSERIREFVARGAVAIGECGLDYHYDHSPRDLQRRAFAQQLAIAREVRRPVVVHTREAVDDTIAMVREAGRAGISGVLHCFGGPAALAEAAIEADWYCSFSGIVTFRKWNDDALLRMIPEDRILIETDAPYLAPVPHRGKRNEPAYASLTLARVAQARAVSAEALGEITSRNAVRFFALATPGTAP